MVLAKPPIELSFKQQEVFEMTIVLHGPSVPKKLFEEASKTPKPTCQAVLELVLPAEVLQATNGVHTAFVHKKAKPADETPPLVQGFFRLPREMVGKALHVSGYKNIIVKCAGPRSTHPVATALIHLDEEEVTSVAEAHTVAQKLLDHNLGIIPSSDTWTKFAVRVPEALLVHCQLSLYPTRGPANTSGFLVKEQFIVENIPVGTAVQEILDKLYKEFKWPALLLKELKPRGSNRYFSIVVGSQTKPPASVVPVSHGKPLLINPDKKAGNKAPTWSKTGAVESEQRNKIALYLDMVEGDTDSTVTKLDDVMSVESSVDEEAFPDRDARLGSKRVKIEPADMDETEGGGGDGSTGTATPQALAPVVFDHEEEGFRGFEDALRPASALITSARPTQRQQLSELHKVVETLGERICEIKTDFQKQLEEQEARQQAALERSEASTDNKFERMMAAFTAQMQRIAPVPAIHGTAAEGMPSIADSNAVAHIASSSLPALGEVPVFGPASHRGGGHHAGPYDKGETAVGDDPTNH